MENKILFNEYPEVVDINMLQKMLNIGRNSAYALINTNAIKHFKVGSAIRIPKIYVIEYIEKNSSSVTA